MVSGLTAPTVVAWAPDGRMFVAQKGGQVRVLPAGAQANQSVQLLDISDHVNNYGDHGLLGIAVDSSFATNHYLYLLYVYDANPINQTGAKTSRLSRVTVNANNTASAETVLVGTSPLQPCPVAANILDCIPADSTTHSIGTVRSDADGTLWFGSGDGSDYGGVDVRAFRTYDEQTYAGKIMHIDRNGNGLPGHAFCPSDTDLTHVCTKLYAKGFRNPFRFTLGASGPQVGDVGWNSYEEVDLLNGAGKNYGWPCYEAGTRTPGYSADARCNGPTGEYSKEGTSNADVGPDYSYPHGPSNAVVGGPKYAGSAYPSTYTGNLFIGDYATNSLTRLVPNGSGGLNALSFGTGVSAPVDIEPAPDNGDLVYPDIANGMVNRISYSSATRPDLALGKPTTASSSENAGLGPENAVDGNSGTRWSSGFSDGQWWQVDLGSSQTVDTVTINWEAAYASQFQVSTSTDGTNFTAAATATGTGAGLQTVPFTARAARYVRITGTTRATPWGVSFWDASVYGPSTPVSPDLALGQPASSSSSEDAATLGPANAVDGVSSTRWSSAFADGEWWQVDLGSAKTVSSMTINWETAYASQYRISTSTDGTNFTTAADVTGTGAGPQTTAFAARTARYVRVTGTTRATQWGVSFWDASVYGPAGNRAPTAVASGTPTSGAAPLSVAFKGDGSTDPDADTLTYDWDFGDGSAHSTSANPTHVYSTAGVYTARLTVNDGHGGTDSQTVGITAGNPPTVTMTSPTNGSTYRDGQAVSLVGSATDSQGRALTGSALDWHVILHHVAHIHDLGHFTGSPTSFVPLTSHDSDSNYDVTLTATDASGLSTSKTVNIIPQTVSFTLASAPAGAPISYAGVNQTAPFTTNAAVGFATTITAAPSFVAGGVTYNFVSWSDGGAAAHNITIPATNTTLTATYSGQREDKALGHATSASSTEASGLGPANAVDGNSGTRWSSSFTNSQWWQVDLGRARSVDTVTLNWEAAYASTYTIRTSTNGTTFTTAATVTINSPGVKTSSFTARSARYVRITGTTRATQWGISFWDASVFGAPD
jgi:PKD repeat protein